MISNMKTLAKWVEQKLIAEQVPLGLSAIYYGDQRKIPTTPTACVETGDKVSEPARVPRIMDVTITIYVILYLNRVATAVELREELDELSEQVEAVLNADAQMGDQVIDSYVSSVETGYQQKERELFKAARLTLQVNTRSQLPSSV